MSQPNPSNSIGAGPPSGNGFSQPADRLDDPKVIRVVEEYLAALEAGQPTDRAALQAQHPEIAEALGRCLDALEFVQGAGSQLQSSASAQATAGLFHAISPLGDFKILREVGRGGMGVVYEALQLSLSRRVALKVLPFAAALDSKQRQRFQNEAQAAAQLHHTHIVPVFAVGSERGLHYYAMQFIEGRTLAVWIGEMRQLAGLAKPTVDAAPAPAGADTAPRAGPATVRSVTTPAHFRTVAQFGMQAAEALEHAHQLGVVHRDIKPANLLVDDCANLWVTDFGLAHCRGQTGLTLTGDLVGTLRYMSPEQALAKRAAIDHRTDVYSLGAVLYECLTLEPAWTGKDREELLRQIALEDPQRPRHANPAVPLELETIVGKAMEKDPDDRYATAQELADDLRRFLEDRPIRAQPPTLWQRACKWARRHQAVVRAASAFATLAIIGLAASTVLVWQEKERTRAALAEANAHYVAELEQRRQAEANYQMARELVDRYYTKVSESRLLRVPGLQPLRKELLQNAKEFYSSFVAQRGGDPNARADLALALCRLAQITEMVDSASQAVALYEHARELEEQAAREQPDNPAYQRSLASIHQSLGILHRNLGRTEAAESALTEAVALYEQLASTDSRAADFQKARSSAYQALANLYAQTGREGKAEIAYLEAVQALEEVLRHDPADHHARHDLALNYHNLGVLYRAEGKTTLSQRAWQQSLDIREQLLKAFPTDPQYQSDLGAACQSMGLSYEESGRQEKADTAYRRALAVYQDLVRANPAVTRFQNGLAETYHNIGTFYLKAGQLVDAERNYLEALKVHETLAATHPERPDFQEGLALVLANLGRLYHRTEQSAKAEASHRKALALLEPLVRDHPERIVTAVRLSTTYRGLADALTLDGRLAASLDWFTRAVQVAERARDQAPADFSARQALGNAYFSRAYTLTRLRRFEKATPDWERALALAQGEQITRYRYHRARLLVEAGQHAPAAVEVEHLLEGEPRSGANLYNVACLFALCSAAAKQDEHLTPADLDHLVERYATRAVALLAMADATGFFATPANREHLHKDSDLQALRAREDFKKWLAALEK
jgi:serine/threonine protein kinase/Flp pilus assembly protein TadD